MVAPVVSWNVVESLLQICPNINGGTVAKTNYYYSRIGFKQKPPFDIDTPLYYRRSTVSGANHNGCGGLISRSFMSLLVTDATNAARAKFVGEIGQASQIGSTLTSEFSSTYGLVVTGIAKALRAARLVAKGKFGEAGILLDFTPPTVQKRVILVYGRSRKNKGTLASRRKVIVYRSYWQMPGGKMVAKSLGNKWLWYSYGVKPLIDDLYNASKVFVREVPGVKITGKGSRSGTEGAGSSDVYSHRMSVKVSAFVKVKNPNLWLANQLGLINPAQMVNEGIPFSFVIDWFSNWSNWLQQLTDFAGLEIARPTTIVVQRTKRTWRSTGFIKSFNQEQFVLERKLAMPAVKLRFTYERPSWQRGANAISLLVQFLRNSK